MAMRSGNKQDTRPGDILLVVHDFVARSPDELSLAKGDRIELIERDDDFGDGWFLGKHMNNGNTGLFPEVYTTPAPKGTLTNANNRRASDGPSKSARGNDAAVQQQRHASAGQMQQPQDSSSSMAPYTTSPLSSSSRQNSMLQTSSPVMTETLSVIDEHITHMSTPRGSVINSGDRESSVYSAHGTNRVSYIAGAETDEEDSRLHTEDEVMQWSPDRVAEYLDDHGVEKAHCDVFREQEISGEVLLAMDQSSIFIKEFELGPVGRRLKTWHKIKALQDEVRRVNPDAASAAPVLSSGDEIASESNRDRSLSSAAALPRGLSTTAGTTNRPGRSNTMKSLSQPPKPNSQPVGAAAAAMSPLQTMTAMSKPENTSRPSAQGIRQMQSSRRHSSMDSTSSLDNVRSGHKKQPSMDKNWVPGQGTTNGSRAPVGRAGTPETTPGSSRPELNLSGPSSPGTDIEKGYFSSTEIETRGKGRVLVKKAIVGSPASPSHSRPSSLLSGKGKSSHDPMRSPVSPITEFTTVKLADVFKPGSSRAVSSPILQQKEMKTINESSPPTVTKLDPNSKDNPPLDGLATSSPNPGRGPDSETSSVKATPSPSSSSFAFWKEKAKPAGLRAISDAVTRREKQMSPTAMDAPQSAKEDANWPAKTGASTPSTEEKSLELTGNKSESHSRTSQGSEGNLMPPTPAARKPRPRTKKSTSAYLKGLEHKSPQEQMAGSDYSGWMKKKSGSLMAAWRPRLFVLRGRRLSYYYSDKDTEEKGLIDISFHRVLPAQDERLTGMHATITGAGGGGTSPASPTSIKSPTTRAEEDLKAHPKLPGDEDGLFIFKLVPPKSGLAKGVNFTKPTVHYFAVNSRQEGRLWMAALMKATIDRDENSQVTTTYNQKTISLQKARARRERPPALKEEERAELDAAANAASSDTENSQKGLGIGYDGVDVNADLNADVNTDANVETNTEVESKARERASTITDKTTKDTATPATTMTTDLTSENSDYDPGAPSQTSTLDQREREAIAIHAFAD